MASAVAPRSSRLPKKNRPVYERLPPASPTYDLRVPTKAAHREYDEPDDIDIRASYSTPYFTFTCEDNGGRDSPTIQPQLLSPHYKFAADSAQHSPELHGPSLAVTLAPPPGPPFLQAGASSSHFSEGCTSTVSLLGDSDELQASPSSAALGKDWRSMQVYTCINQPHPFSF